MHRVQHELLSVKRCGLGSFRFAEEGRRCEAPPGSFGASHPLPAAAGKTNGVDDRHRPKVQQRRGGRRLPAGVRNELLPQAVTLEYFLILVRIGASEVPQKSVPPADQHLQAAAGGVIVLVGFQVLGEPLNATGEGADLNFGRSGVRVMAASLFDLGFVFGRDGHVSFLSKMLNGSF